MTEHWNDADRAALEQLCVHFGIACDYHDVWGTRRSVAHDALLALLNEFDQQVDSAQSVHDALRAAQASVWSEALPPVIAIDETTVAWELALRLPESTHQLEWQIFGDAGILHQATVLTESLELRSRMDIEGVPMCERRLQFSLALKAGYYRLLVQGLAAETLIISAPAHCYRPAAVRDGGRVWGPAVQLYALRSGRNWGIGDFGDLAQLVDQMAERGADVVGLNPLHALFTHNPAHASPYSPSSRRHLNPLYIDVEAIDDFRGCERARHLVAAPAFQTRLARLRETPLVDYAGVAGVKYEAFEALFAHFGERHLWPDGGARDQAGAEFLDFVRHGGQSLQRHVVFEALQAHLHAGDPAVWGWPAWPREFHDPAGDAVRSFCVQHAGRIRLFEYLQWQATRQLQQVSERARTRGMGIGLYLDLAVSADRGGSDAWSEQSCFAGQASVGAPPDEFNPSGQGWGLPPLRPDHLRASHYRFFIDTLRANMRAASALRIDHVMGLMRLFWIPPGHGARDGAYVHYRLDEMLAIVALESQRNHCMVIGEDLGTVADEVRNALARFDVLSYRLLYFERHPNGDFKPAADYPASALAAVSTHDLATLAGWWSGHDLQLRLQLGLFTEQRLFEKQLLDRAQGRVRLLLALHHADLLSAQEMAQAAGANSLSRQTVQAVHAYLAAAPSALMMVQLEDVMDVVEQANMPSTVTEHPNWQRKLPLDLQTLASDPAMDELGRTLAAIRPRRHVAAPVPAHAQARIPRATYRLQFHKDFGFDDALPILPYLARLGVSHVYCSPIHRARAGSTHGYDVVAHDEINPELGGPEGFARFCAALQSLGMGQLLDMVPNHMGVLGGDNAWWNDVLENGPASLYAQHFDIDWHPLNPELTDKVLLPVLGDHYGDVLTSGDLTLRLDAASGALSLRYFEHLFPLAPETYTLILGPAQERIEDQELGASLASVAAAFGHLPARDSADAATRQERARDKELLKARLARLLARHGEIAQAIAAAVAALNIEPTRDALHALVEAQAYRLAFWRVAGDEINYRRFFDINELAALRMEREEVFLATQSFALDMAASGVVDGLRIDHPDGLADPARYFAQLQQEYARRAGLVLPPADAQGRPTRPLYVVAEKIAAAHEEIPQSWHIHGTTGYRFANVTNGVLVDGTAGPRFDHIWRNFSGVAQSFKELAYSGKRDIMRTALASELQVLSTELLRIARADRRTRDYTHNELRRALAEVIACFPVYRTYIIEQASAQDQRYLDWAVTDAQRRSQDADLSVFGFVRQTLLGQVCDGCSDALLERARQFAIRFQQFSAPVTAKGVEDTAFYRYFPLSSLNEVGGEPSLFGVTVADFHGANANRAARWPHTMLATSTHDNKRSEDVRARINVLSEMPARWRLALRHWRAINQPVRKGLRAAGAPAHADEYLLYQTLLGTLPAGGLNDANRAHYTERIVAYMCKAARESKSHTRWTQPDLTYEGALEGFVRALLGEAQHTGFLTDLQALGAPLAWFGALNSLSTVLLKFTSPGVPDLYQGQEHICLTLVDPDNRQPVDYAAMALTLTKLQALDPNEVTSLLSDPHDGCAKMWFTWRLLALRQREPDLMRDGDYRALEASGAAAAHVIAFARQLGSVTLVVLAGRLFAQLLGASTSLPLGQSVWTDTSVAVDLPDGTQLADVLSGATVVVENGQIALATAFARLPGAALICRS